MITFSSSQKCVGYKPFCGIQHNRQLNNVVFLIQIEKWKTSGECTYKAASKSLTVFLKRMNLRPSRNNHMLRLLHS